MKASEARHLIPGDRLVVSVTNAVCTYIGPCNLPKCVDCGYVTVKYPLSGEALEHIRNLKLIEEDCFGFSRFVEP